MRGPVQRRERQRLVGLRQRRADQHRRGMIRRRKRRPMRGLMLSLEQQHRGGLMLRRMKVPLLLSKTCHAAVDTGLKLLLVARTYYFMYRCSASTTRTSKLVISN
jgi:hypothetical protein